jgi:hypothetical protein
MVGNRVERGTCSLSRADKHKAQVSEFTVSKTETDIDEFSLDISANLEKQIHAFGVSRWPFIAGNKYNMKSLSEIALVERRGSSIEA